MVFYIIAYLLAASGIVLVSWRLVKVKGVVSVARMEAAQADARLEETQRAARAAESGRAEAAGYAREALEQTGQALAVARNIELVSDQVQGLTDYLVGQIEGQAAARGRGRHAVRGDTGPRAVAGGGTREDLLP